MDLNLIRVISNNSKDWQDLLQGRWRNEQNRDKYGNVWNLTFLGGSIYEVKWDKETGHIIKIKLFKVKP